MRRQLLAANLYPPWKGGHALQIYEVSKSVLALLYLSLLFPGSSKTMWFTIPVVVRSLQATVETIPAIAMHALVIESPNDDLSRAPPGASLRPHGRIGRHALQRFRSPAADKFRH